MEIFKFPRITWAVMHSPYNYFYHTVKSQVLAGAVGQCRLFMATADKIKESLTTSLVIVFALLF